MLEDITTVTPTSKETLTLYLEMQLQPIRSREVFFLFSPYECYLLYTYERLWVINK